MSLMCNTHECMCTSFYHVLHCIHRNLIPKRAHARNPKTTPSLIRYQHTSDEKSDLADIYMTALNICIPRDWSKKSRVYSARDRLPSSKPATRDRLPMLSTVRSAIVCQAFTVHRASVCENF